MGMRIKGPGLAVVASAPATPGQPSHLVDGGRGLQAGGQETPLLHRTRRHLFQQAGAKQRMTSVRNPWDVVIRVAQADVRGPVAGCEKMPALRASGDDAHAAVAGTGSSTASLQRTAPQEYTDAELFPAIEPVNPVSSGWPAEIDACAW